jgi:hypothetical protein
MSKRKATTQELNPLLKVQKLNLLPEAQKKEIEDTYLAPLSNKIYAYDTGFNESLNAINTDFGKPIIQNDLQFYKEMSNFIAKQLADKSSSIDNRKFEGVNIYPPMGSGEYDPEKKKLNIYANSWPLRTFIHEGTHALDDLHMRTYQKEALDFLAKYGKDNSTTPPSNLDPSQDPGYWYNSARKIIPSNTFNKAKYAFGKGEYTNNGADVKKSLINGANESFDLKDPPTTYEQAKQNYQGLKKDSIMFNPLSEFVAFGVENLNTPWKIRPQNPNFYTQKDFLNKDHGSNLGRKFLKSLIRGTYKNFKALDNDFTTNYPKADSGFLKRLEELRNFAKYKETTEDLARFREKINNYLNGNQRPVTTTPNRNNRPVTTTSTTPSQSFQNPITQSMSQNQSPYYGNQLTQVMQRPESFKRFREDYDSEIDNPILNATTTTTTTPTNNPTSQFQTTVTRPDDSPGKLIFNRTLGAVRPVRFQPY